VGSSHTREYLGNLVFNDGVASTPTERGTVMVLTCYSPFLAVGILYLDSVFFGCIITALLMTIAGRRAKGSTLVVLWIQCVLRLVCAMAILEILKEAPKDHHEIHHDYMLYMIVTGVAFGVAGFWTHWMEEVYELMMVFVGTTNLVMQLWLHNKVHNYAPIPVHKVIELLPGSALWLLLGSVMLFIRVMVMRRAVKGIQQGKAIYRDVFKFALVANREDFARLRVTVAEITQVTEDKEARQLLRDTEVPQQVEGDVPPPTRAGSTAISIRSNKGAWGFLAGNVLQSEHLLETMLRYSQQASDSVTVPVQTLDQLHAQAFLVYEIFLGVVVRLGKDYNGKFRLKSSKIEGAPVRFAPWNGGPVSRGRFEFGGIKSVRSCVMKLDVAYRGDVTRLTDVCRESLYFESVQDLESCLKAMVCDPELEIVKIKNTMLDTAGAERALETPPFLSTGMKFVSVKVRLVGSDHARSLCVDTHVCELLLMLTDIGRVQTQEMRDSYREWRKCKRVMTTLWRASWWARVFQFGSKNRQPSSDSRVEPLYGSESIIIPTIPTSSLVDLAGISGDEWGAIADLRDDADLSAEEGPLEVYARNGAKNLLLCEEDVQSSVWNGDIQSSMPSSPTHTSPPRPIPEKPVLVVSPKAVSSTVELPGTADSPNQGQQTALSFPSTVQLPPMNNLSESSSAFPLDGGFLVEPRTSFEGNSLEQRGGVPRPQKLRQKPNLGAEEADLPQPSVSSPMSKGFSGKRVLSRSSRSVLSSKDNGSDFEMMEPIPERAGTPDSADMQKVLRWLNESAGEDRNYEWDGGETSWGLAVSGQMEELLEGLCRMATLGISDFLDRQFDDVRNDSDQSFNTSSSLGSIAYTSQPASALAQRRPVQVFLIVLSVLLLRGAIISVEGFERNRDGYAFGPYQYYRLETLLSRNGSVGKQIFGPGLSDFGVIGLSKCSPDGDIVEPEETSRPTLSTHGRSILATYPEAVGMTGWFVNTGATERSQDADPAYFNVWGTNELAETGDDSCAQGRDVDQWWKDAETREVEWCGAKWFKVGAAHWRYSVEKYGRPGPGGHFWEWPQAPLSLPRGRGMHGFQSFLLQPNWYDFYFFWCTPDMFSSSGLFFTAVAGFVSGFIPRRKEAWLPMPHQILGVSLIFSVLSMVLHGLLLTADGVYSAANTSLANSATLSLLPVGILLANAGYSKPLLLTLLWTYGVSDNVRMMVMMSALWHDPLHSVSIPACAVLLFVGLVTLLRLKELVSSTRMIRHAKFRYDSLWKKLYDTEAGRMSIEQLDNTVKSMVTRDFPDGNCRQYNRLQTEDDLRHASDLDGAYGGAPLHPLFQNLGLFTIPDAMNLRSRVTSCNQLFCQAAIASLLLSDRLKDWASASQGFFRESALSNLFSFRGFAADVGSTYVKWNDVRHDAARVQRIHWTPMKRHARCMEKMLRSYDNDPSRLLDIARSSIAFESLSDLTICLEAIWADSSVVVSRVINRMSKDYNADETGGYRDVCINLRLVSPDAQALGAELHVCEVQLILLEFATLRSEFHFGCVVSKLCLVAVRFVGS